MVDAGTRILLLGSLPGEISLAQARYYANPRNQFWRLTGAVIGEDLEALDYDLRLQRLLARGIGLWDVVESASRRGSLDAGIRRHRPNRLAELAATLPQLAAVGFNGGTAAAIGRRQLEEVEGVELVDLPSSSPAYTLDIAEKRTRWLVLGRWLARASP
jgi:hypoxanthine-DNA glycosylase